VYANCIRGSDHTPAAMGAALSEAAQNESTALALNQTDPDLVGRAFCILETVLPASLLAGLREVGQEVAAVRDAVADSAQDCIQDPNHCLVACIYQNDCIQFDDGGGLDTGALSGCFLGRPPNPCLKYLNKVTDLAASVVACFSSEGKTEQAVCLIEAVLPAQIFDALMDLKESVVEVADVLRSGAANPDSLLGCLMENECLALQDTEEALGQDGAARELQVSRLVGCFIPIGPWEASSGPWEAPCALVSPAAVHLGEVVASVVGCLKSDLGPAHDAQCVVAAVLPSDVYQATRQLGMIVAELIGAAALVVLPILQEGLLIPGDLILYTFGWAETYPRPDWLIQGVFKTGKKWYYCLFSLGIFILGIEALKVFAARYVCWVQR